MNALKKLLLGVGLFYLFIFLMMIGTFLMTKLAMATM